MNSAKLQYLYKEMQRLGHGDSFFTGYQCGLVMMGYRGVDLHDDMCAIITSQEYLDRFKDK